MSGLDNGDGSDESGGRRGEERAPCKVVLKMSERVGGDDEEEEEGVDDEVDEVDGELELEPLPESLMLYRGDKRLAGKPEG